MSTWRKAIFGLALICGLGITPTVRADAEEDYKAGYEAYRKGDMGGAMKNLEKAAAANHVRAQALLGQLLDVADNNEQAMKYYRMAADQGDAEAMFAIGVMIGSGDGIEKNEKVGLDWMRKSAEKGYPPAVAAMAGYYMAGAKGGAGSDGQGGTEAKRWITAAAEQDNLPAMRAVIDGFKTGKYGFPQDPAQAAAWEAKLKAKQKPAVKAEDK